MEMRREKRREEGMKGREEEKGEESIIFYNFQRSAY